MRLFFCWLFGHADFLQMDHGRMCLRCVACGRETPGWTLDRPTPVALRSKIVRFRQRVRAEAHG